MDYVQSYNYSRKSLDKDWRGQYCFLNLFRDSVNYSLEPIIR